MTISERTIKEISPQQSLAKRIAETEEVVAEWKRHVAALETLMNTTSASLARAKDHRASHALQSSLGDMAAITAVEQARSEQHSCEQSIADLQISLPQAQAQLATAERNAASARRELAKLMAEGLMKKRIALAGQIDGVIADFGRLFGEFEKLGNQIANADAIPRNMHGMADHESAIGLRRVRAALPKFFDRVYPNALHDELHKESLAIAEARFWNLPPLESEQAA